MRNRMKVLVASLALAAATPAAAQFTFSQPGQPLPPTQQLQIWNNVARVNLGVSFYNSTWYSCYSWPGWNSSIVCSTDAWASYIPFTFGPQIDLNLDGPNNISVGFNVLLGSVSGRDFSGNQRSGSVTVWEPTLDYVAKFGPSTQDTVGRFRLGGGMYIGPNSGLGGAFRIGGGGSFLNTNRLGVGLDLVVEAGGYQGYWIGGLQLLVSPEFHF
jgi:hypothetical protein